MLTEDQVKNLKPGDPLIIHGKFKSVDVEGDIWINAGNCNRWYSPSCVSLPSEYKTVVDARDIFRNMSEGEKAMVDNFLSSYFRETKKQDEMRNALKKMGIDLTNIRPKHDPCRLFKAGDEVEYRPKDGRANPNLLVGRRYKVSVDEPCDSGIVQVECDGLRHIDTFVAYNNLELVTPVEELESFGVRYSTDRDCAEVYHRRHKNTVAVFYRKCGITREQAEAHAEAIANTFNEIYKHPCV